MTKHLKIRRADIKVRKRLPSRLVVERVHPSKKTYRRVVAKRLAVRET